MLNFRSWLESLVGTVTKHTTSDGSRAATNPYAAWLANLRKLAIEKLETALDVETLVSASADRNGFVREGAIHALDDHPGTASLSAIIARLNDWVPQVRDAAQRAYLRYLDEQRADAVFACLGDLRTLRRKTRHHHADLLSKTERFVERSENRPLLRRYLATSRGETARYLLARLQAVEGTIAAAQVVAAHSDPSVRLAALTAVADSNRPEALVIARKALSDRSSSVRTSAFRFVFAGSIDAQERQLLCRTMLLDPSVGTRSVVCWAAHECGFDLRTELLARMAESAVDAHQAEAWLWHATKLGMAEAVDVAKANLESPRTFTRMIAYQLLFALCPQEHEALVLRAWRDPSSKLKRFVLLKLRTTISLSRDVMVAMVLGRFREHDGVVGASLVRMLSIWSQVDIALQLLASADTDLDGKAMLSEWDILYSPLMYEAPSTDVFGEIQAQLKDDTVRQRTGDFPHLLEAFKKHGLM